MDVLSLAFTCGRDSDKVYDISEFGLEVCSKISFLGWNLLMSLSQLNIFRHTVIKIRDISQKRLVMEEGLVLRYKNLF